MYMPDLFAVNERQTQIDFIRTTGWGYLTGVIDDEPYVTHLPFLVTGGTGEEKLVAHMARANPHWESFANGKPQLVVFPGPHTYITPSWYNTDKAVPTWNYTTAHVYGTPVVIDNPQTVYAGQQDLVNHYEEQFDMPWRMEDMDTSFIDGMLRAIVSFEILIERIQCKFKLNQNRPAEDQQRVVDALESSTDANAKAVAELMKTHVLETAE